MKINKMYLINKETMQIMVGADLSKITLIEEKNSAGKSTIISGILQCLGVTNDVIRDTKNNHIYFMEVEDDNTTYNVAVSRRNNTGIWWVYDHNFKLIEEFNKNKKYKTWLVKTFFPEIKLDKTDYERKNYPDILNSILNVTVKPQLTPELKTLKTLKTHSPNNVSTYFYRYFLIKQEFAEYLVNENYILSEQRKILELKKELKNLRNNFRPFNELIEDVSRDPRYKNNATKNTLNQINKIANQIIFKKKFQDELISASESHLKIKEDLKNIINEFGDFEYITKHNETITLNDFISYATRKKYAKYFRGELESKIKDNLNEIKILQDELNELKTTQKDYMENKVYIIGKGIDDKKLKLQEEKISTNIRNIAAYLFNVEIDSKEFDTLMNLWQRGVCKQHNNLVPLEKNSIDKYFEKTNFRGKPTKVPFTANVSESGAEVDVFWLSALMQAIEKIHSPVIIDGLYDKKDANNIKAVNSMISNIMEKTQLIVTFHTKDATTNTTDKLKIKPTSIITEKDFKNYVSDLGYEEIKRCVQDQIKTLV